MLKHGVELQPWRTAELAGTEMVGEAQSKKESALPHTFTIDADGALQDEHVGDASIEGRLKKLIARAREIEAKQAHARPAQ
jgi:hypothetical protein